MVRVAAAVTRPRSCVERGDLGVEVDPSFVA
jgi:hypothetical protein